MNEQNFENEALEGIDDEREVSVAREGLAMCGAVGILYAIGRILYVAVAKDTLALPEVILFAVFLLIIWITNKKNNIYDFSEYGKNFDTELTRSAKKKRLKKYVIASLPFAVFMGVIDGIGNVKIFDDYNRIVNGLFMFIFAFIIDFSFEYIISERKVKSYNKYLKTLDDDEF